jgi:hypothetical protein
MPNKKNQNFVPKFLLKKFSTHGDGKSIGVWVVESDTDRELNKKRNFILN